ncbi:hypothetical protein K5X82_15560 [Halosquirtibacter xylanolyticus]|uniref:hypothetical protein n=1 Tax=Halosquirtibacter xylanolyticus TaxID=3374599 RepID=UPI003748E8A7|nr:hypothetical protein K5X82_15560 [Prolixibacteraceae bacterium]
MRLFGVIVSLVFLVPFSYGQRMSISAGLSYPLSVTSNREYEASYIGSGGFIKGTTSYYFSERLGLELDIIFQSNDVEWRYSGENATGEGEQEIVEQLKQVGYDTFTLALLFQYRLFKKKAFAGSMSMGAGLLFNFNEKKLDASLSENLFEFKKKASPTVNANIKLAYFPKKYLGLYIEGNFLYSSKKIVVNNRNEIKYNFLFAGIGFGVIFGG